MELLTISFIPAAWVDALALTLLHSLWQGLLLAALTACIMLGTQKRSAALRYRLLAGAMALFVLASLLTCCYELNMHAAPLHTPEISQAEPGIQGEEQFPIGGSRPVHVLRHWIATLSLYSHTLVYLWFLVICIKCIRLMAGIHGLWYLKHRQVTGLGVYWEQRLTTLSHDFALRRPVTILQSGLARVPLVIGHLKPVILLPLGLLNGLSEEAVEAILCHELAHIKRRDYLVNIMQSIVGIIFFFNPAVLWISALIKAEREHCCDDLAIARNISRKTYISALISCEEFRITPAYAMGFAGKRGHLLARVTRMVSGSNSSLGKTEKLLLSLALVSSVLISAAFSGTQRKERREDIPVVQELMQPVSLAEAQADADARDQEQQRMLHEEMAVRAGKEAEEHERISQLHRGQARIDSAHNEKASRRTAAGKILFPQTGAILEQDEQGKKLTTKTTVRTGITANYIGTNEFDEQVIPDMIRDLSMDRVAEQSTEMSFQLSYDEFRVNDKVQPETLLRKYRQKYLKRPDWIILYNYNVTTQTEK
jgi:bla regulator protein BlaR1